MKLKKLTYSKAMELAGKYNLSLPAIKSLADEKGIEIDFSDAPSTPNSMRMGLRH